MYEAMELSLRNSIYLQATVVSVVLIMVAVPLFYYKYELDGSLTIVNETGEELEVYLYRGNVTRDFPDPVEFAIPLVNNSSVEWGYTYTLQEMPELTIELVYNVTRKIPMGNSSISVISLYSNFIKIDIENGRTRYTITVDDLVYVES